MDKAEELKRKKREAAVYDYSFEANKNRPTFGSFFDPELFAELMRCEFDPDLDRLMEKYVKGKKVLIIGASHMDVELVLGYTDKVEAVDISEKMVRDIKSRYKKVKAFVGDAEHLDELGRKYDVIFCRSILHHLHPFSEVVERMGGALKEGGVVLVASEPGYYNPFAYLGRWLAPSREHTPDEKAFRWSEFNKVMEDNFERKERKYYFVGSMMAAIVPSRLKFLKGVCRMLLPGWVKADRLLLDIPGINRLAWVVMGVWELDRR